MIIYFLALMTFLGRWRVKGRFNESRYKQVFNWV